jgi:bifunctional lysine-specific demethylase and histidyl-hydroxylase NO66
MQRTRPEPIGPLAQLAAADRLAADTPVRLRRGLRLRVTDTGDAVSLVLLDRTITVPAEAADAVKAITAGDPVRPADLAGLDPDAQLTLTRRLLREGVVVLA